jgi:hypothetical protein
VNRWNIPGWLENEVKERDRECVYCCVQFGSATGPRRWIVTWEHIINDATIVNRDNIVRCCFACNSSKGTKTLSDWLKSEYCRKRGITLKARRKRKKLTRFYHATTMEAAVSILREGFRDATGNYLTDTEWTGVWLSDRPLDENEGANGHTLLAVQIDATLVEPYEWEEEDKTYREFLVPADVLNAHAHVRRA